MELAAWRGFPRLWDFVGRYWPGLTTVMSQSKKNTFGKRFLKRMRLDTTNHVSSSWTNSGVGTMAEGLCIGKLLTETLELQLESQDLIDQLAPKHKGCCLCIASHAAIGDCWLFALQEWPAMAGISSAPASNPLVQPLHQAGAANHCTTGGLAFQTQYSVMRLY